MNIIITVPPPGDTLISRERRSPAMAGSAAVADQLFGVTGR
ncbi:MAG: hypothetical protein PHU37_00785 [Methanoculleus chikugoensis]|nr:hypothetical protein [Methanoculleus chikugoensis]